MRKRMASDLDQRGKKSWNKNKNENKFLEEKLNMIKRMASDLDQRGKKSWNKNKNENKFLEEK